MFINIKTYSSLFETLKNPIFIIKSMKETAIVYMVAGMSSRFGGRIKQFAKVGPLNETLIEISINEALKAGFSKIIFIVGNKTEQPFKEKFGNSYQGIAILYATQIYDETQRDRPWGTNDAVCSIKDIIDCPFIVCNGDDLYGENTFKILYNHLQNEKSEASIGYRLDSVIPDIGSANRAIYQINEKNEVTDLQEVLGIEKSDYSKTNTKPEDLCSMNIFALHPKTVKLLDKRLNKFKKDHKDDRKIECFLPVELSELIKEKKITMKLYPSSDDWIGITHPEDEEIVRNLLISKK